MAEIWLVSDTHFGHKNILKFRVTCPECGGSGVFDRVDVHDIPCPVCSGDGEYPMRPFQTVTEMDEFMVQEWNKVVRPQDKVYHLGDVAIAKTEIATVGRCAGHKRLVRGNHDDHPIKYYLPWFEEIHGTRKLDTLLLSHIPLHPESLGKTITNVHGHTHNNPTPYLTHKYLNVCVEKINYRPITLGEAKERIRALAPVV
jgi:calcineurin-like phosphoesterase family protein